MRRKKKKQQNEKRGQREKKIASAPLNARTGHRHRSSGWSERASVKQKQSVMAAQDSRDTRRPRADADLESKVRRSSLNVRATRLLPPVVSIYSDGPVHGGRSRARSTYGVRGANYSKLRREQHAGLHCLLLLQGRTVQGYHACGPEQEHISSSALVFFFWFCFCHATS